MQNTLLRKGLIFAIIILIIGMNVIQCYSLSMDRNDPPFPPDITGPTEGEPGVEYIYTFLTWDPEDDIVWYKLDWGDGNITDWIGPYESGEEIIRSHSWEEIGTYTIRAKAKDIFNAESYWSIYVVKVEDLGLSLVTVMLVGETSGDNWYGRGHNFTFTNESEGIAEIHYGINGNWTKYTSSFNVSESGENILEWYAVDFEGNYSEVDGPFHFKIDLIPPHIDIDGVHWEAFQDGLGGDWYVRFWTNASDDLSGMDRVEMYINEGLHEVNDTPDGSRYDFVIRWSTAFETVTFTFVHYDKVGNAVVDEIIGNCPYDLQNSQSIGSPLETVKGVEQVFRNKSICDFPVLEDFNLSSLVMVFNRKMGDNNWIVSDANITIFNDPEDITAVYYKIDEGDWTLYGEPLVISSDGNHVFSWYIVDYKGNTSTPDSISFKIDQTPPSVNLWIQKIGKFKTKFTAGVFDNASGVDRVEFRAGVGFFLFGRFLLWRNLKFADYTFPYECTIFGWRNIKGYARAYDEAGNCGTHTISTSYNKFHMFSLLHWLLGILGWLM